MIHRRKFIADELQFLQDKGYGRLVLREDMMKDNSRQFKNCSTVYMKPAPFYLEKEFLKMANDSDLTSDLYIRQFRKPTEQKYWAIVRKYHPHFEDLTPSQIGELESGMYCFYIFCVKGLSAFTLNIPSPSLCRHIIWSYSSTVT